MTRSAALMVSVGTLAVTLLALSGKAGEAASPLLLALSAFVALTLTGAPRRR